ncbi:MAG: iron-sulfur cluster loop [Geobacter sp.]|nr:MAG: iron-sulfur cluster loop [Geobacter sp.]
MEVRKQIVSQLVQKGQELLDKPKSEVVQFVRNTKYHQRSEADKLLNNFQAFPHAFVIGCIADKQVDADIAWLTPYNIYTRVRSFEIQDLANIGLEDFRDILEKSNPKHRFHRTLAEEIFLGIRHIVDNYGGNATTIWEDNPSSAAVAKRFLKFKGIGPKISSMATNILYRDFKVKFSDYSSIDISADVHIQRVFARLGFCKEAATVEEIIKIARELYPSFPGIMDLPIWEIGKYWCNPTIKRCESCYLKPSCPSAGRE